MYSDENALVEKARKIATEAHKGQYRKDGVTPFITHPEGVVDILKSIGIRNPITLSCGWIHDTKEDCGLKTDFIRRELGSEVAECVDILTRDVSREEYKERISSAKYRDKIIKLADVVHNCSTLNANLPEKTIRHKVEDSESFYIPLASKICPEFHHLLVDYIKPWKQMYELNGK